MVFTRVCMSVHGGRWSDILSAECSRIGYRIFHAKLKVLFSFYCYHLFQSIHTTVVQYQLKANAKNGNKPDQVRLILPFEFCCPTLSVLKIAHSSQCCFGIKLQLSCLSLRCTQYLCTLYPILMLWVFLSHSFLIVQI